MFEIQDVKMRKVIDSRGNYTVEATVILDGFCGVSSAPAGASTGATEVLAFPKGGVDSGIEFFNRNVKSSLMGFHAINQVQLDSMLKDLDGSDNFSNLGGNLATAISMANAKAVANALKIPLYRYVGGNLANSIPRPMGNVIGGGKHTRNGTTIQEFLVSSQGKTFLDSAYTNAMVHRRIGEMLSDRFKDQSVGVGDERAWTANISDEDAIELLKAAVKEVSSERKMEIKLGLDFAATSFFENGKYVYRDRKLNKDEQIDYAISMAKDHGFYFVEDPMVDTDFDGFAKVTAAIRDKAIVVGDDLYTTNVERVKKGIEMKSSNGILIKVNQIGTLTATYEAVKVATRSGMKNTISHRSGETTDNFIAHLAVAFSSTFIKSGTIGGERLAKLNELARIEEDLLVL
ncbi:enolase [Oxyplasma meridianum]|uniref:Enolase n=1 Tax=Oxyplasma meridianum TaxID=3073602 RepID=A0AAX4NG49_9ARCH